MTSTSVSTTQGPG
jgi:hypothetical protein